MQMQDRVGQQFGNYRLKRLLGAGGYAEVYLAEHISINALQRAIKIMKGTDLKDYDQDEFLLEARTIANLQRLNPHIVQIHDFGVQASQEEGQNNLIPYIVMEYASEGTLRTLYPCGTTVPLDRIVFYVNQIAAALQCAHDQRPFPITHRDVKPENMLLRNIDHVLLSDFGISVTSKTGPQRVVEKDGSVLGTAAYIAPERLSGHIRRASDQYSLAVVVYEWMSGNRPFDGTNAEICVKHLTMPPPPLYPGHTHITAEIWDVVSQALAKKPEDRFPNVQAFARALEDAVEAAQQQKRVPSYSPMVAHQKMPLTAQAQPVNKQQQGSIFYTANTLTSHPPQVAALTVINPGQPLTRKIRRFFELSPQFARDRRYRSFRNSGTALNMLSALIVGWLLQNVAICIGALLFSSLAFAICIRAIEEKLALFFGVLVALYWGWVGFVLGNALAALLHSQSLLLAWFLCLVFFVVSFVLHVSYALRKNL